MDLLVPLESHRKVRSYDIVVVWPPALGGIPFKGLNSIRVENGELVGSCARVSQSCLIRTKLCLALATGLLVFGDFTDSDKLAVVTVHLVEEFIVARV